MFPLPILYGITEEIDGPNQTGNPHKNRCTRSICNVLNRNIIEGVIHSGYNVPRSQCQYHGK
jgi:hypothetical protein